MKDREEFLASVYAKRDNKLARKKQYKKRMVASFSTAAACLVLMVGLVQADVVDFLPAASGEEGSDGAAMEGITENESAAAGAGMENSDSLNGLEGCYREDGVAESSDVNGVGEPAVEPEAAPEQNKDSHKDIYTVPSDQNMADADGVSPNAYYALPRVIIEDRSTDGEATAMYAAGVEKVEKVQAWVDQLAEKGQVMMVADNSQPGTGSLKMEEVSYIVTIEREPQQKEIYYLTGEVGWYE